MKLLSRYRFLFALYITIVFEINLRLEMNAFTQSDFAMWTYALGLPLLLGVYFLPVWNPFKDEALQRTLMLAGLFWFIALIAWIFGPGPRRITSSLWAYLAYFVVYGGFFGIVEGIYMCPLVPRDLDKSERISNPKMGYEGAIGYLEYEYHKWWRGLNMLWVVIIAIVVSGVINWTIQTNPPPLNVAFQLAFSSVPGIALIVWYMISKTNAIHESIAKLYEAKNGSG